MAEALPIHDQLNQRLAIHVKNIVRPTLQAICGLTVEGTELLPDNPPYIVAANHSSMVDPFAIGVLLPDTVAMHFPAKAELGKIPLIRSLLPKVGAILFDRKDKDARAVAAQETNAIIARGEVPIIFPEATRWHGLQLRPDMQVGTTTLSRRTNTPIVPCGIGGSDAVLRAQFNPIPRSVHVVFGEVLEPTQNGSRKSKRAYEDELKKSLQELKIRANEVAHADFSKAKRPIMQKIDE